MDFSVGSSFKRPQNEIQILQILPPGQIHSLSWVDFSFFQTHGHKDRPDSSLRLPLPEANNPWRLYFCLLEEVICFVCFIKGQFHCLLESLLCLLLSAYRRLALSQIILLPNSCSCASLRAHLLQFKSIAGANSEQNDDRQRGCPLPTMGCFKTTPKPNQTLSAPHCLRFHSPLTHLHYCSLTTTIFSLNTIWPH